MKSAFNRHLISGTVESVDFPFVISAPLNGLRGGGTAGVTVRG